MSQTARTHSKAAPVPKPAAKPALTPARSHLLQRKCACGTSAQGKCQKCDDEKKTMQRHAANHQSAPATAPPVVHDVLGAPGRPLDPATRAFMEPRFGQDFGSVRVHDDSRAAESARAVNARAYTVGQHIAFDRGQYSPQTEEGRHLLAHELAHTVQQGGLQRSPAGDGLSISSESDASEREASSVADAVMQGSKPAITARPASVSLHRAPWGECPQGTKRTLNQQFGELLKQRRIREGVQGVKDKKPGFFTFEVADAAERYMAMYFKDKVGLFAHTNIQPVSIEEADPHDSPMQYMVNEADDYFRSGKSGRSKKQKKKSTSNKPAPPSSARTVVKSVDPVAIDEGHAEEAFNASTRREGAQLKPDFVDFHNSRVYDATTIDNARDKVQKIKGYVKLYETIRLNSEGGPIGVPSWAVGTELPPPPKLVYGVQNDSDPVKICFGVTDFDKYPGVLAYEVVDTSTAPGADAGAKGSLSEPYVLNIGGVEMTGFALPAPSETDLLNTGPANQAIAESVPGVILLKLVRKGSGPDTVEAEIETATKSKSKHQSKIPLTTPGKVPVVYTVNKQTRKLTLRSKKANIPIGYEKLSAGTINKLDHSDEKGLSGAGSIQPSVPLLKGVDLGFEFAEDYLAVTVPLKKPNVPIPGFKVTEFKLALDLLPELKASGTIGFTIGTGKRALMDGVITISVDAEGLLAKGEVTAHIPGVDEAKGTVTYRPSQGWTGSISITTSKIPYVQSANVNVTLTDKGLDLDGGLEIALPGDQHVGLKVRKMSATSWVYTGKGEFKVPRLKPVVISFVYDGQNVTGTATTGFTFKGIDGNINLVYENGAVTGTAHLEITKSNGRLKGYLDVTLNKNRKFSGEGKVSYEIKPGLVASAGIIVDKEEKVTLVGELKFPPYKLFEQHPNPTKRINIVPPFKKNIPIPYLSFGPLGLQAQIGAGLFMEYGIGPGVIKDGFIKAQVNPLEDDPDPKFELGGRISVPMFFSVTGYVSGGIVLDVFIAEAGGKIVISTTAELAGEAAAKLFAKYEKGEFRAEVDLKLLYELFLRLCVSAYAWAEAGFWRFKVKTSKSWNLLDFPIATGIQFGIKGLKKPIAYSSKTGFELPSFDDIDWATPSLDAAHVLEKGITSANGEDDGPRPRPCPVIED